LPTLPDFGRHGQLTVYFCHNAEFRNNSSRFLLLTLFLRGDPKQDLAAFRRCGGRRRSEPPRDPMEQCFVLELGPHGASGCYRILLFGAYSRLPKSEFSAGGSISLCAIVLVDMAPRVLDLLRGPFQARKSHLRNCVEVRLGQRGRSDRRGGASRWRGSIFKSKT